MLEVNLADNQGYSVASTEKTVTQKRKYVVSIKAAGISGKPNCAFFGVILLDRNGERIGRKIRWLNDFSGNEQEYKIVFRVPEGCNRIRMIYRVNRQTLVTSSCRFVLLPLEQAILNEAPASEKESYDTLQSQHIEEKPAVDLTSQQEDDLERNIVWILYHPGRNMESIVESIFPKDNTIVNIVNNPFIGSRLVSIRKAAHTYVRDIDYRAKRRDYFFNYRYSQTWGHYLRRLILNRLYAQFKDQKKKIIINDPAGSLAADLIMECFPNSKIMFLVQDGRKTVHDEIVAHDTNSENMPQENQSRLAFVTRSAEMWRLDIDATMHAYDHHSPSNRVMIKEEELLVSPTETVQRIYDLLDLRPEDADIQEIAGNLKQMAKLSRSEMRFSQEEKQIMHRIMAKRLQKLGYPIDSADVMGNESNHSLLDNNDEGQKIQEQKYNSYGIEPLSRVELLSEQEEILERNLVWILSNPRSGTTWLGTQLLSYNTHVWNEPLIGACLVDLKETADSYIRDIDFRANRRDYLFNASYSATWKRFVRKLILNRIYAQFKDLESKVIIKEPNGSMAADIISQCLPNSKIIALVRDGRDTVDSRLDALKKGAWGTKVFGTIAREEIDENERTTIIRRRAKLWRINMETVMKAYENHRPENRMLVRYEDLRRDTLPLVTKIYQFIGVSIPEKRLGKIVEKYTFENLPDSKKGSGKFVRAASPGKWRDSFGEEEKKVMDNILGDMLEKLGYIK